ncbi:MAG TPA: hypothetical protein PLY66_03680 [Acidobacteriota bacterium]|nr:hypothetical protein [Acidobacteriota bacterium]HQF87755.1 hypothetical protein [Acidobacteriota bacterium]HQG92471.1 hypothetical protein [Acidobacteriota bacterium]HQK86830.1 hypothetical protein [Acidobacteriota bacterium]
MAASGRMLESWKEIAEHCGRSVRTVQRWAQRGLPVYRDAGGTSDRVYAFAEEIDAWRLAQALPGTGSGHDEGDSPGAADSNDLPSPTEPEGEDADAVPSAVSRPTEPTAPVDAAVPVAVTTRRPRRIWFRAAGLLLAVLAVGAAALYFFRQTGGADTHRLARALAEGDTVVGYDTTGQRLWATRLPGSVMQETPEFLATNAGACGGRQFVLADLEGDGATEVLANVHTSLTASDLYCLGSDGRVRWSYRPGESLNFGGRPVSAEWFVRFFHVSDADGDGRKEIVLPAVHYQLFPAKMVVLGSDGAVRGQYLHTGHFLNLTLTDLNRDGRTEILTVGINNAHRQGFLALLDPSDLAGISPPSSDAAYTCAGQPPGHELYYLLFPRDCINRATHEYGGLDGIVVEQEQVVVSTFWTIQPPEGVAVGSVLFYLDRWLALRWVDFDNGYSVLHAYLERIGHVDHPFRRDEINELDAIRYWDGDTFTAMPTPNRRGRWASRGSD